MKKIFFSLAAVVLLAVTLVSCGGGGSPKATAEKFLNGLYHMDFADAKAVSTEETKKQVEAYEQMMSMGGDKAKEEAKKIKIEVKEPVIDGDNATAEYTMTGNPTPMTLKMVKKDGKWLAQWSKMDMGGGAGSETPSTDMNMDMPADSTTVAPPADGMTAPTTDSAAGM